MQRFTIYLFLSDALHVSDGISVHHQELKTAHTASGICQSTANRMQRFTIYLFLSDPLHVSDGYSVHHQELKTAPAARLTRLAVGNSNGLTNA